MGFSDIELQRRDMGDKLFFIFAVEPIPFRKSWFHVSSKEGKMSVSFCSTKVGFKQKIVGLAIFNDPLVPNFFSF